MKEGWEGRKEDGRGRYLYLPQLPPVGVEHSVTHRQLSTPRSWIAFGEGKGEGEGFTKDQRGGGRGRP